MRLELKNKWLFNGRFLKPGGKKLKLKSKRKVLTNDCKVDFCVSCGRFFEIHATAVNAAILIL